MFTVQISDRSTFASKAKKSSLPVFVVRTATVVPVQQNGGVIMTPAANVDYSIEFNDSQYGPTRWTFREVVLANENGDVPLDSGLMGLLNNEPKANVIMRRRSGSF